MTIPCTGQVTAIASMYIVLQIHNSLGMPVPGSPLKVHLRKRCIAFRKCSLFFLGVSLAAAKLLMFLEFLFASILFITKIFSI